MLQATLNTNFYLNLYISEGNTNLYPTVTLYLEDNPIPTTTLYLTHSDQGNYFSNWIPTQTGQYTAIYSVFADVGHTIPALQYNNSIDNIMVREYNVDTSFNSLFTLISRDLGLANENAVIDNTNYDTCNQLISARIRCFDSQVNANLATSGGSETLGLIASYNVSASYDASGLMQFMRTVLN